jgi:uncharacterized protein
MEITPNSEGVSFYVQVQPRASHEAIAGEYANAVKIRLSAPPVDNRANQALTRMLAERLNVPLAAVRIVSGENSRRKRIVVAAVTPEQVLDLLRSAMRAAKRTKD